MTPSTPPEPELVWSPSVVDLLERLEQVPGEATGAMVFGNRGTVLIEDGHVCWVVAQGLRRTLTDHLFREERPPISRAQVEEVFRRCRAEGVPLGEALVAGGFVQEGVLRRALLRHSAEGLAALCRDDVPEAPTDWRVHRRRYDARYRFSIAELFAAVGSLSDRVAAVRAEHRLGETLVPGARGVAFCRHASASAPYPVAQRACEGFPVREIVALGKWVSGLFDVCETFARTPSVACTTWCERASVVGLREGGLTFAAPCESRAASAQLVARWTKEIFA